MNGGRTSNPLHHPRRRRIRRTTGVRPRRARTSCGGPRAARGGVRTSALHSPTKRSSGARAMTTSARHALQHRPQQRRQVYHRSGFTKGFAAREIAATPAAAVAPQPAAAAVPRGLACARSGFLLAAETCRPPVPGPRPAPPIAAGLPCHAAGCSTYIIKSIRIVSSIYAAGCCMTPATGPGTHALAPRRIAAVAGIAWPRGMAHFFAKSCAQIHTRRPPTLERTGEIRVVHFLGAIAT
jgi:hypothetical protein